MSEDYAGNVAEQARPFLDDAQPSEPQVSEPKPAVEPWKPLEPKPIDYYTYGPTLKTCEDPRGVIIAESRHSEGFTSGEELEVIRELSPTPAQFVLAQTDIDEAVRLARFYVEHQKLDRNQALQLIEGVAHIEKRKELEEAARLQEEERRQREAEEAKQRKWQEKQELEDALLGRYLSVRDSLENAQSSQ